MTAYYCEGSFSPQIQVDRDRGMSGMNKKGKPCPLRASLMASLLPRLLSFRSFSKTFQNGIRSFFHESRAETGRGRGTQ